MDSQSDRRAQKRLAEATARRNAVVAGLDRLGERAQKAASHFKEDLETAAAMVAVARALADLRSLIEALIPDPPRIFLRWRCQRTAGALRTVRCRRSKCLRIADAPRRISRGRAPPFRFDLPALITASRKRKEGTTMSTQTRISEVDLTYDEAAKARIAELRAMRETIPHLVVPTDKKQTRRLSRAASLPPAFVKLTVVATESSTALVRGGSDPNRMRDLTSYADAFEPVAAELEALLLFIRHSVVVARNTAGADALTTFALAKRLAKRPETAELAPIVDEMADALGVVKRKAKTPAVTAPQAGPVAPAPPPVAVPSK